MRLFQTDVSEISIARTRLFLAGLILLVLSKSADGPIVDLIPSLAQIVDFFSWKLSTEAQVFSLKILAIIGLSIGFYQPKNAIALGIGTLTYSLFTMALYSQVYSVQLNYIPHSENIHFFLLCLLIFQSISIHSLTGWMSAIIGWTYLAALITKLQNIGLSWATGETLQSYFLSFWLITENPLLKTIGESHVATSVVGISTLIFEAIILPLLVSSKTRNYAILTCLTFHAAVWALFGINFFTSYLVGFVLIWNLREES